MDGIPASLNSFTTRPLHEAHVTDTPPDSNTQVPNSPASENPPASPSRSHHHGSAAFLQRTPLDQSFLLTNIKPSAKKKPQDFCRQFDADTSNLTEESRIELASWLVLETSPVALATNIQKFAISDESARIDIARIAAEKAPSTLAKTIQNFEISDESVRIELAGKVAEKNASDLASHFQEFAISDQSARTDLARKVAEKSPHSLAKTIQNFEISDESAKIEIARKVAEKEPSAFAENIQKFAISDEGNRIKFAHIVAEKKSYDLARHIQKFAISDESVRTKLAHIVAEKAPFDLGGNIQQFTISDESVRIDLANRVVETKPGALARNIQQFAISDESARIGLAQILAEKSPSLLARSIQQFEISDESAKIRLAHIVAEKSPEVLVETIQQFAISDESARIGLIHIIAEEKPYELAKDIQQFAISEESARIDIAHIIAEKSPYVLATNIHQFAISDESARMELAEKVAEKNPDTLTKNIQHFAISDERARIKLARSVVGKALSHSKHAELRKLIRPVPFEHPAPLLENFNISDQSVRANLYASVYLRLIAERDIQSHDEKWINNFFSQSGDPMQLTKVADQWGNQHAVINNLLETAKQQSNPYIRETLSTWTNLVSLRFMEDQLPEATWQNLKNPLQAIQKWRAPTVRYSLTQVLAQQCLSPDAETVNNFLAFCKRFTKPHTHLYPVLLFPLFQTTPNDHALKDLVELLLRPEFKDAKRQKLMVNALLALVQADRLPDELKRALLRACLLSSTNKKENASTLVKTASPLECLVSLAQENTELGNSVLGRLESIWNPSHFNEQMVKLFQDLFSLKHLTDTQNVGKKFSDYWGRSRQPVGLISYAVKMQSSLDEAEKVSVLEAMSQFVNATVLSPNPEQAFKQLRYDTSASEHLRLLENRAPEAFKQWQQSCIYEPSAAFLADGSGSTKQTDIAAYLEQRIVMDRHVPSGTYPLLEQVLTRQMTLTSALQQAERQEEADLLQLLDKQTPVEQRADLIARLLGSVPQSQFHQDLTDLHTLLMPSSKQDVKQFNVIDTDAAEDLFLCGTEVAGSCQSIQGEPELNKALMGYVLDGKYRMLAIQSAGEPLMGRRMLRLLWNESKQQPVLHLERLYRNPGIPEKYEQALVELALQKARQMGCVLVSHDDDQTLNGGDYLEPLIAHPTPWPFEYVDAERLGVKAGEEKYELSGAKIVTLPH